MKPTDQQLLEEAYEQVAESQFSNKVDYLQRALKDPKSFGLVLDTLQDEDWEGNTTYLKVAYIYALSNSKDYQRIDNSDDIAELIEAFEEHNPEGINDQG